MITVKDTVWQGGFAAAVESLEASGRAALIEQTQPYVSMPGEAGTSPGRAVVLRVTP